MRRVHGLWFRKSIALGSIAALSACDGCHRRPYAPWSLSGDALRTPSEGGIPDPTSPDAGVAPHAAVAFPVVTAHAPPGDPTSWPVAGEAATAPAGRKFDAGFLVDADGDGIEDVLAWSRSADGLGGNLWFYPGKRPAEMKAVATVPAGVSAPGCITSGTLSQIGPRVVTLDVSVRCSGDRARAQEHAARWISVSRFRARMDPEASLEIRIGTPVEGETIGVTFESLDRDGDGRADLLARVIVGGAPNPFPAGPTVSAPLTFLDRPAGYSRDATEPASSLAEATKSLVGDARRRTTAAKVRPAARALRSLFGYLCGDGTRPLVTTNAGPTPCGETKVTEQSIGAEIEASINLGDPLGAMAALGRLDALGVKRKDIETLLTKHVPTVHAARTHTTHAAPSPDPSTGPSVGYGPVAYDARGDLLVRTAEGVVRVDGTTFEETRLDGGAPWPTSFSASTNGAALTALRERCESPALIATFGAPSDARDIPLPILAAASPRCTGPTALPLVLLGRTRQGELFAARGEVAVISADATPRVTVPETLVAAPATPPELGIGRSSSGATIAVPESRGFLVTTVSEGLHYADARLWPAPLEEGATFCVPDALGSRLACAVRGAVAVYERR